MTDECQTDALRLREPEWTQGIQMWMPFEFGPMEVLLAEFNEAQRSAFILLMMQEWRYGSLPPDDKRLAAICRITPTRFIRQIAPAIRPLLVDRGDGRVVTLALQERREKTLKSLAQKTRSKCEKNFKFSGQESNEINASATTDIEVEVEEDRKEDKVPPTEVPTELAPTPPTADQAPTQTNLFGDAEDVPAAGDQPKTPGQILYSEGLEILARLTERDLADPRQKQLVANLLSKMRKQADGEDAMLMDILRRAATEPPASPIGWIKEAIANSKIRLVVNNSPPDPMDGRGIQRWCAAAKLERAPDGAQGKWISPCRNAYFDVVAGLVANAAKLPWTWNGDWSPLLDWIAKGYLPYDITAKIEDRTTWSSGYTSPASLNFFNSFFKEPKQAFAA